MTHFPDASMMFSAAQAYVESGLSILPISRSGDKQPAISLLPQVWDPNSQQLRHTWAVFRERRPTNAELTHWYAGLGFAPLPGIGIVCGAISGGLEVIDFDDADTFKPWAEIISFQLPELLPRLVIVRTPRPGYHVYFRSSTAGRNRKIAQTRILDSATGIHETKTLIEVKGESGLIIAPPSPASCHPRGRQYELVSRNGLTIIPTLNFDERYALITAAARMGNYREPARPRPSAGANGQRRGSRPGDYFAASVTWAEVLMPHGWTFVSEDAGGVQNWRRPGKDNGVSATVNYEGSGVLHVFSASASPFEADTSYNKFTAYVLLDHGGDYSAAARALQQRGFGVKLSPGRRRRGRRI